MLLKPNGFLMVFWGNGLEKEAENVWKYVQKFQEIDKRKKEGNDLDEFEAHKFLESLGETLTVMALREKLRQIDVDNNNRMALTEYLMFKYQKSVEAVVNAPQSDNKEELEAAQTKVDAAQTALIEMQKRLEEQTAALKAQKKAEDENKAALDDLKKQEDEYNKKCSDLERQTKEGTIVQKNKAVQELAALKAEDPLPLRRAKITQESAVRKAEKARKASEEATAAAEGKFQEAQKFLDEVRARSGGSAQGDLWWMDREIKEAKKYLPKSKQ